MTKEQLLADARDALVRLLNESERPEMRSIDRLEAHRVVGEIDAALWEDTKSYLDE